MREWEHLQKNQTLLEKIKEQRVPLPQFVAFCWSEIIIFMFAFFAITAIRAENSNARVAITFLLLLCLIASCLIDFNQDRWGEFDESSRAPYIIKISELTGACVVVWQWFSPTTNLLMLLIGVLLVIGGVASQFTTPEKTLPATLISIKSGIMRKEGYGYELLFQVKDGKTYSFFTLDTLNLQENSACTLTVRGRTEGVLRFAPMSQPRVVEEWPS